jgi:outer membrane lipoprotein-sorting protein
MTTVSLRIAVLLALVLALAGPAPAADPAALDLMKKQREVQRVKDEEERQKLKLTNKAGASKERKMVRYLLSGAGDLDKILVRFLTPRDVENTGLLTWEGKDGNDDQWLYLPAVKRPKRIAASGKKNRFMGTDFAFEDLRPENVAANAYALVGSETLDGVECFVVDATPAGERQAADSGYSRRRIWVRKDTLVTIKREYYDKQAKLEKVETHRKLVNVAGAVWRPNEIEMHDVQNGSRTLITIENRLVNRGLKDDFFTETELIR